MTSISEDPTLPLDLDGTSNQLSGAHGLIDASLSDASLSGGLEQPGTFVNLTSAGRKSPHRTRTMKDQESQLSELKKDNFGLKLRIYHLEEALRKRWGDDSDGWQLNIELQVQMDNFRKELRDKDALLLQAKSAIDSMTEKHKQHIKELEDRLANSEGRAELEDRLAEKEAELEDALRAAEEAKQKLEDLELENDQLAKDLEDKQKEMNDALEEKDDELDKLKQDLDGALRDLADRDAALRAVPPKRRTCSSLSQTVEPWPVVEEKNDNEEMEQALHDLQSTVITREKRIKELELELAQVNQRLAEGASQHAQQMKEQAVQLDQLRDELRDAEAQLRRKDGELDDQGRQLRNAQRRMEDAERLANDLQQRLHDLERELRDVKREADDAEHAARKRDLANEREIDDLRRKLRDAQDLASHSRPEMEALNQEIEDLKDELKRREDENDRLRAQLKEKEDALAQARRSTHLSNMDLQKQSGDMERLRAEIEALRQELKMHQNSAQGDMEAALAARDAIIDQLRRELQEAHDKLTATDNKLFEVTTSSAAELGVLRGTIDDLSRQLEHQEVLVRQLRSEVAKLTGEKAGLAKEVEKLKDIIKQLQDEVAALQAELKQRNRELEQAEQAVEVLEKEIEALRRNQTQASDLDQAMAELAQLKAQLAAMEHAMKLKDKAIKELQEQLQDQVRERVELERSLMELRATNSQLEDELASLRSKMRIDNLSSDELKRKLTDAYTEIENLTSKLREAENALLDKGCAYDDLVAACDALNQQVKRLQRQLAGLTRRPTTRDASVSVGSPPNQGGGGGAAVHFTEETDSAPPPKPGSSNSTTMIFGSLSENLLLTILQRLQDLQSDISAGRADSTHAASSLSTKMEELSELQKNLEACLQDTSHTGSNTSLLQQGPPPPPAPPPPTTGGVPPSSSNNTSYTAYYFMGGGGGGGGDNQDESSSSSGGVGGGEGGGSGVGEPSSSSSPKKSPTPRRHSSPKQQQHHASPTPLLLLPRPSQELGEALRKTGEEVAALQCELAEVKKHNVSLQAKLDKLTRMRDTGVGTATDQQQHPERYRELEREVDRLLAQIEAEKDQSCLEREEQQRSVESLQARLRGSEAQVSSLRAQLQSARREAEEGGGEREAVDALRGEMEELGQELNRAKDVIAELQEKAELDRSEKDRLAAELSNLRLKQKKPPEVEDKTTLASSSMPDLLTPEKNVSKSMTDSWTSPPQMSAGSSSGGGRGDAEELRALKERHEEIARLNQKLQHKCREQLFHTTPPSLGGAASSRPGSGGAERSSISQAQWQARVQREQDLLERERSLLAQLRDCESRSVRKEREWKGREGQMRSAIDDLQKKLVGIVASKQIKDEEAENLQRSLLKAEEKIVALEQQLDRLLAGKNSTIEQLEAKVRALEHELQQAWDQARRLGGGGGRERELGERDREASPLSLLQGQEEELSALKETVDDLSHQLSDNLEEAEELRRQNALLEEQKSLLDTQLSVCQEQVGTLQGEVALYQKLLQSRVRERKATAAAAAAMAVGEDSPDAPPGSGGGRGEEEEGEEGEGEGEEGAEAVLEFVEEMRGLRNQLDETIQNNAALANELRARLSQQQTQQPQHTHHPLQLHQQQQHPQLYQHQPQQQNGLSGSLSLTYVTTTSDQACQTGKTGQTSSNNKASQTTVHRRRVPLLTTSASKSTGTGTGGASNYCPPTTSAGVGLGGGVLTARVDIHTTGGGGSSTNGMPAAALGLEGDPHYSSSSGSLHSVSEPSLGSYCSSSSLRHPRSTHAHIHASTSTSALPTLPTSTILPQDTSTPHTTGTNATTAGTRSATTNAKTRRDDHAPSSHGPSLAATHYYPSTRMGGGGGGGGGGGLGTDTAFGSGVPKRSKSEEHLTTGVPLSFNSSYMGGQHQTAATSTSMQNGSSSYYHHHHHHPGPSSNNRRPPSDVGLQYPSSSYRGGGAAAPIPPSRLSDLLLHGPNDFESLESKLKEALQSPGLQGADRAFLEELLMYLRMQRRQLDESRRLLERLEQNTSAPLHSTSLPASRLDTGESGTVGPTRRAGGGGGGGGAGVGGRGGWASQGATPPERSRSPKLDLSAVYEQLLRTRSSLAEAKTAFGKPKPREQH